MGGFFSKEVTTSGMGPDPRPTLVYSSLQFLDLVLIRSEVRVSDFGMDSRIAGAIRHGSLGLQVPALTVTAKWDRVGLIQLPSFIEKYEYNPDNIEVTEATFFGIQTLTLRQVLDSASEVAIRRLHIGSKQIRQAEAEATAAIMRARKGGSTHDPSRPQRPSGAGVADSSQIEGAANNSNNPNLAADDAEGEDSFEDENAERLEYLSRYYQFTGPVINRAYGQCMDKLEAMFRFVMQSLKAYDLAPEEAERVDAILEEHSTSFMGLDGSPARGIPFASLLNLFRALAAQGAQNTFSDSEIFELVGAFTLGDDRVSLSNTGFMSKQEFMNQWRASLERTLPLRRLPREILSGAFVSQALQSMGLLPSGEDGRSGPFFLPMDFAMLDPPEHGWPHLQAKGEKKPSDSQLAQETAERREAEEQEAHLEAHLPKLTGNARAHHDSIALAAAISSTSLAARDLASSSSPSSPHQSLRLASALTHDPSVHQREGAAIVALHAHGASRVGIEQQVVPPSQREDQDDGTPESVRRA